MKKSELQNVLSMFLTFFKSELRCSYKMCSYKKKSVLPNQMKDNKGQVKAVHAFESPMFELS